MLTLAPKSQRAFSNFKLLIVQGIEKLPGSLSFCGSFFLSSALLSSVNITVSCSAHFHFFVNFCWSFFFLGRLSWLNNLLRLFILFPSSEGDCIGLLARILLRV